MAFPRVIFDGLFHHQYSTGTFLPTFFYFRHSGIVQKTDMSGSLTAGWSFPLGHKMCLQFIITQHKFVIVMENTFTLKMKMIM